MATTSFTHRLDSDLKAELDAIAKFEDRSVSYIANQAIKSFVDERKATRELIETGLELIDKQVPAIEAQDVHNWLLDKGDRAFPDGKE